MEVDIRAHVGGAFFFILFGCLLDTANTHEKTLALSGCLRGSGCSQCPSDRYTLTTNDEMLCCPGCATAVLYHGETPNNWCVCYVEVESDAVESKTLKFPGGSTSRFPPTNGNNRPSNFFFSTDYHSHHDVTNGANLRDALYILDHGTDRNGQEVSKSVHEALTLMANTIEDINARLTRLENILLHSGQIDRLGSIVGSPSIAPKQPATIPPSSEAPCRASNFTRVGGVCYHVSVWKDHRLIWENANKACEEMGAKLAEPIDRTAFITLTQYLSLAASTTGYSYWIGGLYPGISWRWYYAGTEVTLSPSYWTGLDSSGNRVSPGDTAPGRCLSFSYLHSASNYFFAADECGYEKYYICELLERSHRHF